MSQRIIDRSHVGDVLQQIYTSDLNIKITLFFEGGYFYFGKDDIKTHLPGTTVEEAVTHLAFLLSKEFPLSNFTTWWMNNFGDEKARKY